MQHQVPKVQTRCPKCDTRYRITPEDLLEADGLACCYRCGTVFDIVAEDASTQEVHQTASKDAAIIALDEQSKLSASTVDTIGREKQDAYTGDPHQQTEAPLPTVEADREQEPPAPVAAPHDQSGPRVSSVDADGQTEISISTVDPDSLSTLLQMTDAELEPPAPTEEPHGQTGPPPSEVDQDMPTSTVDPDSLSTLLQVNAADDLEALTAPDIVDEPEQSDPPKPADATATIATESAAAPRFDIPDDLEPLQPSPDVALDIGDSLYEKRSRRGFYYGLVAVLLIAALGVQLTWQHRAELLKRYPMLAPLCEFTNCVPRVIRAPQEFRVMQREIKPTPNLTNSLTLKAKIRNDAGAAQPYPDIQLSLLDNNGEVLVRRRLAPSDYLFPPPAKEKVVNPGEVVTITLDFKDPGAEASGFVIGFL